MSELRPIQPEDLFRHSFLQSGDLSSDGRWLVYAATSYDAENDADTAAIWLQDTDSGAERQLTSGLAYDNEPAFSPDGQTIAFTSTRSDTKQLYAIARDGGEARQLTNLAQGVGSGPVWSPDGQAIAFTAGPDHGDEPPDLDNKPYRVTRPVYRFDAIGYVDPVAQDVFIIAADGSGERAAAQPKRLTSDSSMNSALRWSPDGQSILYQAHFEGGMWHRFGFAGLRIVNLAGETRTLLSDWGVISLADWLPSGEGLAFVGTTEDVDLGTNSDLWTISLAEGAEPENRSASLTGNVGGGLQPDFPSKLLWEGGMQVDASGEVAYVQVQDRGAVQLYRIALTGAEDCQAITAGERSCYILGQSAAAGRLLFSSSTIHRPPELCSCDTEGGDERQHSHLYDDFYGGIAQGGVRHLQFNGTDGEPVEGWLLLPPEGEPPYPMVMYIHGGPHGAFGHMYHFDMQMLAGAGYAVLLVNHRASSGYGDEFGTAIKGAWGVLDYGDLMAGVDEAIEQGLVDPDRMGVCGLSGGGNLSSWTVGQTDRFKAAVPENPVTNWLSFYGVSDIGTYFSVEELGGTPWEIPEVYRACSPITFAHNCTTPTLLVQCEHDWRCPAEQSEQFYAVLKAVGCPVEMLRIPRASHAGAINEKPAMRRAQNDALLDWMNHWVLGKPRRGDIV